MPYGTGKNEQKWARVKSVHGSPGEVQEIHSSTPFHGLFSEFWTRSGTNKSLRDANACRRYTGPMKIISIDLPLGSRLPYKVFSKKANRMVWARKPIKVYKLVPDRSRVNSARGLDLPPNRLDYFYKIIVPVIQSGTLQGVYAYDNKWYDTISGDTWMSFTAPNGSRPIPIAPDDSNDVCENLRLEVVELDARTRKKLYEKVKNQQVNLLTALAERTQTIKLLADLVKRLVKAFLALKRGNLVSAALHLLPDLSSSKAVSSEFLLIQYGIKPLIDDINGLIDHLNEWENLTFDVKVSKTKEVVYKESVNWYNGVAVVSSSTTTGKVTVTYKVRVSTKDNFNRNLDRLGFTNLGATVWELLPGSFLADWVIPFGDWLNNWDAFSNLETVYCSKTVAFKEVTVFDRKFGGRDSAGYVWEDGRSHVVQTKVKVNREVLPSMPSLPFPSVGNPFSYFHAYNFVALLNNFRR